MPEPKDPSPESESQFRISQEGIKLFLDFDSHVENIQRSSDSAWKISTEAYDYWNSFAKHVEGQPNLGPNGLLAMSSGVVIGLINHPELQEEMLKNLLQRKLIEEYDAQVLWDFLSRLDKEGGRREFSIGFRSRTTNLLQGIEDYVNHRKSSKEPTSEGTFLTALGMAYGASPGDTGYRQYLLDHIGKHFVQN